MDEFIDDGETLHAQILRAATDLLEDSRRGGADVRLRERLRELKAQLAVAKVASQRGAGRETTRPESSADAGPLDAAA